MMTEPAGGSMKFMWPQMLWLGVLLPALVLAYLALLRVRKKRWIAYPGLATVKRAQGRDWRRHVPAVLILAALACLAVALARPTATLDLPVDQRTIIMVMDVSGSMSASDVSPTRLSASQIAAKAFAARLPSGVRIGVVAYAGEAHLVQAPTLQRDDVLAAIDRFQLERSTAIGSGITVALETLFPDERQAISGLASSRGLKRSGGISIDEAGRHDDLAARAVPPGSYDTAAIVLLTDGQNTVGPDPIEAAQVAASHGVKIFTVGFGTPEGTVIGFDGWSMRVRLDEETLRQIANLTHGEYFRASSGADLAQVYQALHTRLALERKATEITVLFAAAAALLMLAGVALSVWWFGRVA
jgi:Ca-activated chloride channel family protein